MNSRHKKFCEGIVAGKSNQQAYTDAGYESTGSVASAAATSEPLQLVVQLDSVKPAAKSQHIIRPPVPVPMRRKHSHARQAVETLVVTEGRQVDYFSASNDCWIPAAIAAVDSDLGMLQLDVKLGAWMPT